MNGISWACGIGPTIRLGGRRLVVRGRTLGDYALFEAEILRERGPLFDRIRSVVHRSAGDAIRQRDVARHLFENVAPRWCDVSVRDTFEWLNTCRGRLFAFWLSIRDNDPAVCTLERVAEWSAGHAWRPVLQAMDQASANDERCALVWRGLGGEWGGSRAFWPAVFRRLAESPFHLTAADTGRLTLQPLRFCLSNRHALNERVELCSLDALDAWRSQAAAITERAIGNLIDGRAWNAG